MAQGTVLGTINQAPPFAAQSITPFVIGNPASLIPFPNETTLTTPSPLRTAPGDIPNVTQAMVDDPNVFLSRRPISARLLRRRPCRSPRNSSILRIPGEARRTSHSFRRRGRSERPGRADHALFWIETFYDNGQICHQLQYSQRVLLNFNGLSWPHVSVATLIKQ